MLPKTLTTRDIRDYMITITPKVAGGVPFLIDQMSGGNDEKFSITPESPFFEDQTDCHGNVYRDLNPDRRHTLTLNLMSTNPANTLLTGLALASKIAVSMDTFRVDIVHRKTLAPYCLADHCYILTDPDMSEGVTIGERNWEIRLPFPEINHIGINPDV